MVDSQTLGVLTTLLVDVVGLVLILLGFVLIRRCRGDSQKSQGDLIGGPGEFLFDEQLDRQRFEDQVEAETDLVRRKTVDLRWEPEEETLDRKVDPTADYTQQEELLAPPEDEEEAGNAESGI